MGSNRKEIQKKDIKMNDENELKKHYKSLGYKDLHDINLNPKVWESTGKSKNNQWHQIGRCLYLVAYHDLKAFGVVDTSD